MEDEDESMSAAAEQLAPGAEDDDFDAEHEGAERRDEAAAGNGASSAAGAGAPASQGSGADTALRIRRAIDSVGAHRADRQHGPNGHDRTQPKLSDHNLAFGPATVPPRHDRRRRERTPSDYTAGSGRNTAGGGFTDVDREVEAEAIEIAMRYSVSFGAVAVRDVQSQNLGWDLEFVMDDGRIIPVEVKGSRGDTSFMITRNERRASSSPEYLLLWIVNLGNPAHAVIRRFTGLGAELNEDHLSPLSWVVDRWPSLTYDEVHVQPSLKDQLDPASS